MSQGFDVVVRDRISASIAAKLRNIEASADRASTALTRLQSTGGLSGLTGGFNQVSGAAQSATNRVLSFALGLGRAQSNASILVNSLRSTGQSLRSFASGLLLLGAVGGVVAEVDSYRTLQNQLRTTTTSQAGLNESTRRMFEIANKARVPVDDLTKNFVRYDKSLEKLGFGQEKTFGITETIAKSMTLSGASVTEASAAMTQLSQAFNKSKLDGDEFKTTTETFPAFLNAATVALGATSAEVFKLSKTGKLSATDMIKIFTALKEKVDADFKSIPRTIGQAFTQLANTVKKAFGEFDTKFGFTDSVNSFLDSLASNLPTVVNYLKAFGAAFAVLIVPSVISLFGPITSFFLTIPGLIAGAAAFLAFFSDKIKITGDGVTTLSDLLGVLSNNFIGLVSATLGINIDKIFNAENAQSFFDRLVAIAEEIQSIGQEIIATSIASGEFFAAASFKDGEFTLDFLFEPINYLFATIQNGLLEIPIQFIEAFEEPIKTVMGWIDGLIKGIGQFSTALGSSVPLLGGPLKEFGNSLSGGLVQPTNTVDFLTKGLKAKQTDASAQLPQFQKGIEAFDKAYKENLERMKGESSTFREDIIKQLQDAAQKRIAIEEQIKEASKANPDALRKDDPVLQQLQAQQAELLRFDEALEKHSKLKAILTDGKGVSFGDEFKLQAVKATLAGENFSDEIIKIKLGMEQLKPVLQQTGSGLDVFNKVAQNSPLIPQGATQQQGQAKQNDQAQLQATDITLQSVTTNAGLASSAILNIQTSADAVGLAITNMSTASVSQFNAIGSAASRIGASISSSISSAMVEATISVAGFANSAVVDLERVATAASSIQAPGSFGGGGGFLGFASGGYTGNGGVNDIAGVVHGREFVMPASQTSQYRPILEAMRAGRPLPSASSSSSVGNSMNVTVQNFGSSKISVERLSASDIRIIAREEAANLVSSESPRIVASQLRNPNSPVSKSLARNTKSERRR